jgi:prepilin-type N-terminal cleavage/methylation domain-containing protein
MVKVIGSRKLNNSGFTLIELLVAAAMGVIIIGVAIGGLINAQEASRKTDQKLEQQSELQRALNYIASDIQEGQQIKTDQDPTIQDSPYKLAFYILRERRPGYSTPGKVGYYVKEKAASDRWRGPAILYRRRWPGTHETPSSPGVDNRQNALIDAIALESINNPRCQFSSSSGLIDPLRFNILPTTLTSGQVVGISVVTPKPPEFPSRAVICLRGKQALSGGTTGLDVSVDAAARIRPTP